MQNDPVQRSTTTAPGPDAIEAIEYDAFEAWFRAAAAVDEGDFRWSRFRRGDATCYGSATEPSILVNRVLGIGSEYRPTLEQLVGIRETYANAGGGRFFLHVLPERMGDDYESLLAEAGYEKYRGWMKFIRRSGDVGDVATDLTIRPAGPEDAASFASIVGNAFGFQSGFLPAIAAVADAPGWQLFMGFDNETPACTGALFVRDGIGYLDFGATHPQFRRRGGQTAVLNARIKAALAAGCTAIVTMTGEAVPGDEQHSYRNILRAGFEEGYLRENWIPAGT